MKITKEEVLHVAHLAHLELDADEIDQFARQIGTILDYVATLNQVDTSNVTATFNAAFSTQVLREDEEKPHMDREQILSNAPQRDAVYFLVPKVIG
jgi:aspartyl-tRNA(Asn)/glutamyl-tRNA(Gln) amidotransferase subunit C